MKLQVISLYYTDLTVTSRHETTSNKCKNVSILCCTSMVSEIMLTECSDKT
jgi:hypothetical protein